MRRNSDTGHEGCEEGEVLEVCSKSSKVGDRESDGGAVLTVCVLALVESHSERWLFRHAACQHPTRDLRATVDPASPWVVGRSGQEAPRFHDIGRAGAYVAFMQGRERRASGLQMTHLAA